MYYQLIARRAAMGHGADLTTELAADHRLLEMLLARLQGGNLAPGHVERLASILARHSLLTRRYLYPALRSWAPNGAALADKGTESQRELSRTVKDIAARDAHGRDRAPLVAALTEQMDRHIREEEDQLIPALAASVTWHVLEDLGERARAARLL
jgi:hypothetical protein